MRRREFIAGLGSAAIWPLAARAQQAAGTPVIGIVHSESMEVSPRYMLSFSKGLAEVGFVEGRNVVIEHRWDEGHAERRGALLADLIRRQVSVIFVGTTGLARRAKEATRTIPIVFLAGGDPVESGVVASLNRPGGNLTGISILNVAVTAKRLELLRELVPTASSFALLANSTDRVDDEKEAQVAARALGVRLLVLDASDQSHFEAAFTSVIRERAGGLVLGTHPLFA